jgi:hypothetical protein
MDLRRPWIRLKSILICTRATLAWRNRKRQGWACCGSGSIQRQLPSWTGLTDVAGCQSGGLESEHALLAVVTCFEGKRPTSVSSDESSIEGFASGVRTIPLRPLGASCDTSKHQGAGRLRLSNTLALCDQLSQQHAASCLVA